MKIRDKNDLIWIFMVSAVILAWGSIPTWMGYQFETQALRFRGTYYDSQDYAVHISMMRAGAHGEWAYQFRFTTEPHKPAYLRMFYLALGNVSGWLRLGPERTFHLARWLLGFAALFTLYSLLRRIFQDVFWARIAFLAASLGSGLGWLQLIFNWTSTRITPIDFWLTDGYVFFSLSVFPHFAFVTIGTCVALRLWLDNLDEPRRSRIAWIALTSILIQFTNPIAFATVDAAFAGAAFFSWWKAGKIRWADILALIILALAQIPLLAYNFAVLGSDPLWSQFTGQNQTLSPPPDYYLWGFGLFWPLAIYGAIKGIRDKSRASGAALFWIAAGFILAYLPVEIQRRFLQNITIPLAILAISGLAGFLETVSTRNAGERRWQSILSTLFVFLLSLSSIQLSLGRAIYLQSHPKEFYYPAEIDDAARWFVDHAQYNDFVLASEETSQVLAQRTDLRVYLGHEMETLDYKSKQMNVQSFFRGELPELSQTPIRWVVYGPVEREINPGFHPPENLGAVYESPELQIYEVK